MGIFEAVGLSDIEERLYMSLVNRGDASLTELADEFRIPASLLRRAVRTLESKGFVTRTSERKATYAPARPDLAIEALVLKRQEELDRVRKHAQHLTAQFAVRSNAPESARPINLITGREAVAQWWVQVQRAAKREVCIFDLPPYVTHPTQRNPVQADLLARGISYRVLYDESSLDNPAKLEAARGSIEHGEQARIMAGVPIKLIIADGSLALTHDSALVHENAVIVYPSALLRGLTALFESMWSRAEPLRFHESNGLQAIDTSILSLLAAGSKDERIAHQLGVGLRTVRRRVAALMELLGARTRFQAAVLAKERGWLGRQ